MLGITLCFALVFFIVFLHSGVAVTSLLEVRAGLCALRAFVCVVRVGLCVFPVPIGIKE